MPKHIKNREETLKFLRDVMIKNEKLKIKWDSSIARFIFYVMKRYNVLHKNDPIENKDFGLVDEIIEDLKTKMFSKKKEENKYEKKEKK